MSVSLMSKVSKGKINLRLFSSSPLLSLDLFFVDAAVYMNFLKVIYSYYTNLRFCHASVNEVRYISLMEAL